MFRDLFNFKRQKTPAEALVFFAACACIYVLLVWVASQVMSGGVAAGL